MSGVAAQPRLGTYHHGIFPTWLYFRIDRM